MAKKLSPLDIMNTMGKAADKKARKPAKFDPDMDKDDDSSVKGDVDKDFAGKAKKKDKK